MDIATKIIKVEEGFRPLPYLCSEDYPTVGIGLKIGYRGQSLDDYRDFPPMPESVAEKWLSELLSSLVLKIMNDPDMDYWFELNAVRQAVVLSMVYQLGLEGFKKFKKTNQYLRNGMFKCAGKEMLDSRWAIQTPQRAQRHSEMMIDGEVLPYYY